MAPCQNLPGALAGGVNRYPVDDRIGAGEVDVLKDAGVLAAGRVRGAVRGVGMHAVLVKDQYLAGQDIRSKRAPTAPSAQDSEATM